MRTGPHDEPSRDRDELDDLKDEAAALAKAMDAINEAPDTEFYVRIFNSLGERLSVVKVSIQSREDEGVGRRRAS